MKKYGKMAAALLALLISAGTTGIYARANNNDTETAPDSDKKPANSEENRTPSETSDEAQEKDETVYVMTDASGKKTKTIVSDWIKNSAGNDEIMDISNLTDISELKLDGGYKADGSDITWSANGGDVYYRGYSENDLPVDIKITYTLNGKQISPAALAGKSGRVTIRYDYVNNSKKTVEINGKKTQMYTPFMMATGVVLDPEKFSNVKAVNGKVVSDGNRYVVIGCALPGLTESLGLSGKDDIDIPEYFEITADVHDFELSTAITAGSSSIFSDLELDNVADLDELKGKIDELADASDKLCSGTSELCSGLKTLQTATGDLTSGVNDLVAGDEELDNGITTLSDGAKQLNDGAKKLDSSAKTLTDGISSAKGGSDMLLSGFEEVKKGAESLKTGTGSLAEGLSGADAGAKQVNDGAQALAGGSSQLSDGSGRLSSGAQTLAAGTSRLAESAVALDTGADTLAAGVDSAKQGAETLSAGIAQAGAGAASLADGIAQAGAGVDLLAAGAASGAEQLGQMTQQISGAAESLDTTIAYNEQVIAGLTAMQANYPTDSAEYAQLAAMIGTLQQTVAGQQQISTGLKSGAESADTNISALRGGLTQLQEAFKGDGTANAPGLIAGSAALSAAFSGNDETPGLNGGASQLAAGLGSLKTGADTLAGGTEQLVSGTSELDSGAQTLAQSAGILADSTATLAGGAAQLAGGTQSLSAGITAAHTGAVQLDSGAGALGGGIEKLTGGEKTLNDGLVKLNDGGKQFKAGTGTLSSSVDTLYNGTVQLKNGSGTLFDGLLTLQSGTTQLSSGVDALVSGSETLDTGMKTFKKDGIDKIVSAYKNDLTPLFDRFGKLTELSRDYTNFSGAAGDMNTEVKFIYQTEAIK